MTFSLIEASATVRVIVNETGTRVAWNDYDAYGTLLENRNGTTGGVDLRFKYSSKERDNITGYDYFGARYFDRRTARWLTLDPKSEKYPSWSGYIYVLGNPLVNTDPTGAIIKLKGLTNDQTRAFNQTIQTMLESKHFAKVWKALSEAEAVYSIQLNRAQEYGALFDKATNERGSGGTLSFKNVAALSNPVMFSHEAYHAYEHERVGLNKSFGNEIEAILFSFGVTTELSLPGFLGKGEGDDPKSQRFSEAFEKLLYSFDEAAWKTAIENFKWSGFYEERYRSYNASTYDPIIQEFYPLIK